MGYFKFHFLYSWQNTLFFSAFLELMFEAYIEIIISIYLNFSVAVFTKDGETAAYDTSVILAIVCLMIIPLLLGHIFHMPLEQYKEKGFLNRWREVHVDIRTDNKWASSYFQLFVTRRIHFVLIAFTLFENPDI